MKAQIDMIGIVTSQFELMRDFYRDVLDFPVMMEMESYVEFENAGVRFAISTHKVMSDATGESSFLKQKQGQSFELAFRVEDSNEVDATFKEIIQNGAKAIKEPKDMPWGQRTAFFADPDGNIHEIFADLG